MQDRFPKTEERAELQPAIERQPDLPQRDRFIKNWRKAGEGDRYPSYEHVRDGFERDFAGFRDLSRAMSWAPFASTNAK